MLPPPDASDREDSNGSTGIDGLARQEHAVPEAQSPARRFRTPLIFLLAVTSAVVVFLVIRHSSKETPTGTQQAVTADSPDLIRLKGTTQAIESRSILAPVLAGEKSTNLTIVKLTPPGTTVKRGELLVEFDRQVQLRDFIEKQATKSDLEEKVLAAQETENATRAKDETEIREAEDNLSKAQLEMQKVEILSRIDAEKAQETLEGAKATLAQLKQTFDLKRKAAQASIRILQIQLDRNKQTMAYAEANANLLEVHAPIDGIIVLNTIWKQGTMGEVQEGDQISPGVSFMQVVDPAHMEVQVAINQEDLLRLKIGQPASVHLDAYPGLAFEGQLETVDPIGRTGSFSNKVRTFAAVFSVTGHDPRLMPDLSAAVDVKALNNGSASGGSQ